MSSGLAFFLLLSVPVHLLGLTTLWVVGGSLGSQVFPPDLIPTKLVLTPPAPVAPDQRLTANLLTLLCGLGKPARALRVSRVP